MDVKSVGGIDGTAVLQYARVIFGGYFWIKIWPTSFTINFPAPFILHF
jgi:hypothetical protein